MPGIHAVLSTTPGAVGLVEAALRDQEGDRWIRPERLCAAGPFHAAFSGHDGYPRLTFEDGDRFIALEGAVYDRPPAEVRAALRRIAASMGSDPEDSVRKFVEGADGDFVATVYDRRTREMIVFNDRWARLPAYWYADGETVAVSRSLAFLLHWPPALRYDATAMAEFLMMGYVLGDRTLFHEFRKFGQGTLVRATAGPEGVRYETRALVRNTYAATPGLKEDEAIDRCATLFLRALEQRVRWCENEGLKITADVTAGRDSRAIYAGMSRIGADAEFFSDDLDTHNECSYLPALIAIYGRDIVRIPLKTPPPNIDAMRSLTYATDCTVNCWTAFLSEYKTLERRKMVPGPAVRFMGFGGEFIRTTSKPPYGYATMTELVRDDIYFDIFDRAGAARILGIDEGGLTAELTAYFDAYPEPALADQLKRLYCEYYNILVNAGENRQRRHFWTLVPLWGQALFTYQMAEIPSAMMTREFFDRFLVRVEARATQAPFYRRGADAGTWVAILQYHLRNRLRKLTYGRPWLPLRRKLKKWLVNEHRPVERRSPLDEALVAQFDRTPALADRFDAAEVRRIADHRLHSDRKFQLLTLLLYAGEVERRFPGKAVRG
jgi:hypothetical protein